MVRFLHTSDWQLGMTLHMFLEGPQERYNQARFDAIRTLGKIAKEEKCQFMAVCGDMFESNQVDRKTVARALEALKDVPVPVWILPGNHDPLNDASVFNSSAFTQGKPKHVSVIADTTPIQIEESVELIGAPWLSKRMPVNPFHDAIVSLKPVSNVTRIILAHGIVDLFTADKDSPGILTAESLENAINEKKASFIALGDRHSRTRIGTSERIWYSGTPEVTDFNENESGYAQVIDIDGDKITAKPFQVGQWRFIKKDHFDINSTEDIEALKRLLDSLDQKERTAFRLSLVGSISLTQEAALLQSLDNIKDVFAAFRKIDDELVVIPDDADFSDLGFSGFIDSTIKRLRQKIADDMSEKRTARDALMLLVRLSEDVK